MENNEMVTKEQIKTMEPNKWYDLNTMEKLSREELKERGLDDRMTKGQIGFVGATFGLAAYGGYSLFKSVTGFIRRKWNPDKELEREINNLKIKYPEFAERMDIVYVDVEEEESEN